MSYHEPAPFMPRSLSYAVLNSRRPGNVVIEAIERQRSLKTIAVFKESLYKPDSLWTLLGSREHSS
jgi:hypothetical protein